MLEREQIAKDVTTIVTHIHLRVTTVGDIAGKLLFTSLKAGRAFFIFQRNR